MAKMLAYSLSLGIVSFGLWIVALNTPESRLSFAGIMTGLMSVAVGLASVINELHNDRLQRPSRF
jgi:hypothetical protein